MSVERQKCRESRSERSNPFRSQNASAWLGAAHGRWHFTASLEVPQRFWKLRNLREAMVMSTGQARPIRISALQSAQIKVSLRLVKRYVTADLRSISQAASALLEVEELEGGHGDEREEAGEADQDEGAPADQAVLDAVRHVHELRDAVRAPRHGDDLISHRPQLRPYQPLNCPRHRIQVVEPASATLPLRPRLAHSHVNDATALPVCGMELSKAKDYL